LKQLSQRQRVKINAALAIIHDRGYDASTVTGWAREYHNGQGYPLAKAYERALNEFCGGQPKLAPTLTKITRLVQASDEATVGKYDQALTTYINTGDGSQIEALGSMIAQDSVALAVRSGEIQGGVTAENVEAALGIPMNAAHIPQQAPANLAKGAQAKPQEAQQQAPQGKAGDPWQAAQQEFSTGYVSPAAQARWAQAPSVAPGEPRSLLAGQQLGGPASSNPAQSI
jgi:hypothetical protein